MTAFDFLSMIGDYERICDHAENIVESAEELIKKKITFSGASAEELKSVFCVIGLQKSSVGNQKEINLKKRLFVNGWGKKI